MGQTPPADYYQSSLRRYSGRLREPQYAGDQEVRQVRHNGEIRWRGTPIYLSESLAGEPVELAENECGKWQVRFGPVVLGHVDHKGRFHRPKPRRRRRKPVRG